MFVGAVLLLPVQNADAVATWTRSTVFNPADFSRTYMDHAGTWNGSAEVTNTTGDRFLLTLRNTADSLPTVAADTAFDLAITATIPARFRLPVSSFTVVVTPNGANPGLFPFFFYYFLIIVIFSLFSFLISLIYFEIVDQDRSRWRRPRC